jgi:hypothetical protein
LNKSALLRPEAIEFVLGGRLRLQHSPAIHVNIIRHLQYGQQKFLVCRKHPNLPESVLKNIQLTLKYGRLKFIRDMKLSP